MLLNLLVLAIEPFLLDIATYQLRVSGEIIDLYYQNPRQDIVYMGSSRTNHGFNPDVIEQEISQKTGVMVRSLNLGIHGGGVDLSYLMLKNVIEDAKKPRVIVYGVSEFELVGQQPGLDAFTSLKRNPYSQLFLRLDDMALFAGNGLEQKADFVLNRLVPLYRDRQLINDDLNLAFNPDNPNHYNLSPDLPAKPQNNLGRGYQPAQDYTSLTQAELDSHASEYRAALPLIQPDKLNLVYLENLLKVAKARGIAVVLVNMPVNPTHLGFWKNPDNAQKYQQRVKAVADQYQTPLLDLYQNPGDFFKPADFYDSNHLSTAGATKLSTLIADNYLSAYFPAASEYSPDFYKAKISDLNVPGRLPAKGSNSGTVVVTNQSQGFWPVYGNHSVRLSYHWLDSSGKIVEYEGVRTYLAHSPVPGQPEQIRFTVQAPAKPGNYILELDLVCEYVSWFSNKNSAVALRKPILITDPLPAN